MLPASLKSISKRVEPGRTDVVETEVFLDGDRGIDLVHVLAEHQLLDQFYRERVEEELGEGRVEVRGIEDLA